MSPAWGSEWGAEWGWTFWSDAIFANDGDAEAAAADRSGLFLPIDFLMDDDGDLVVTDDVQLASGPPAMVQSCRCALKDFFGEWFLNLEDGLNYWAILGEKYDKAKVQAEFRRVLGSVPGVVEIVALNTRLDGTSRELVVDWKVRTDLGVVFSDGGSFKEAA